jgi:hypothetical protein
VSCVPLCRAGASADGAPQGYPVGWEPDADGFRGHVFVSADNSTVVLAIKGTSAGWLVGGGGPTVRKDRLNGAPPARACVVVRLTARARRQPVVLMLLRACRPDVVDRLRVLLRRIEVRHAVPRDCARGRVALLPDRHRACPRPFAYTR